MFLLTGQGPDQPFPHGEDMDNAPGAFHPVGSMRMTGLWPGVNSPFGSEPDDCTRYIELELTRESHESPGGVCRAI